MFHDATPASPPARLLPADWPACGLPVGPLLSARYPPSTPGPPPTGTDCPVIGGVRGDLAGLGLAPWLQLEPNPGVARPPPCVLALPRSVAVRGRCVSAAGNSASWVSSLRVMRRPKVLNLESLWLSTGPRRLFTCTSVTPMSTGCPPQPPVVGCMDGRARRVGEQALHTGGFHDT